MLIISLPNEAGKYSFLKKECRGKLSCGERKNDESVKGLSNWKSRKTQEKISPQRTQRAQRKSGEEDRSA
jgi:hypothetical protein